MVSTPLKNMSSLAGMMKFPTEWGKINHVPKPVMVWEATPRVYEYMVVPILIVIHHNHLRGYPNSFLPRSWRAADTERRAAGVGSSRLRCLKKYDVSWCFYWFWGRWTPIYYWFNILRYLRRCIHETSFLHLFIIFSSCLIIFASSGAKILQKMENCIIFLIMCLSCFIIFHHFCFQWCKNFPKNGKLQFSSGFFMFLSFVIMFYHVSSFLFQWGKNFPKNGELQFSSMFFHYHVYHCLSFFICLSFF